MYSGIDVYFVNAFYHYGMFAYDHRWKLILCTELFAVFCGFGLRNAAVLESTDAVWVFTPENGYYKTEVGAVEEHWPFDVDRYHPSRITYDESFHSLIVRRKDYGNVLEVDYLTTVNCINDFIINNVSVTVEQKDRGKFRLTNGEFIPELRFEPNLCLKLENRCFKNGFVTVLAEYTKLRLALNEYVENITMSGANITDVDEWGHAYLCYQLEDELRLTYPTGHVGKRPIYLGLVIGNVATGTDKIYVEGTNRTAEEILCNTSFDHYVSSAQYVQMIYNVRTHAPEWKYYSQIWSDKLHDLIHQRGDISKALRAQCDSAALDKISLSMNRYRTLNDALMRIGDKFLPNFATCMFCIVVFVTLCSFTVLKEEESRPDKRQRIIGIDWTRSKPVLALSGVLMSVLSILSAVGLLFWCGFYWNRIISTMPILALCIGIDDMFIMVSSWHRTDPRDSPRERVGVMLSEAAVSITITSVTDVVSFFVGCWTVIPAMAVTYVFTLSFLTPMFAIVADWEQNARHCVFFWTQTVQQKLRPESSTLAWIFFSGSAWCIEDQERLRTNRSVGHETTAQKRAAPVAHSVHGHHEISAERESLPSQVFRKFFGPVLLKPVTKVCVLVVYVLYIGGAFYGLQFMKIGLDPIKLVLPDDDMRYWIDGNNGGYKNDRNYKRKSTGKRNLVKMANEICQKLTFFTNAAVHGFNNGHSHMVVVNNAPNLADPHQRKRVFQLADDFLQAEFSTGRLYGRAALAFWLDEFERSWLQHYGVQVDNDTELFYNEVKWWLQSAEGKDVWAMDVEWTPIQKALSDRKRVGFNNERALRNNVTQELEAFWPSWTSNSPEQHVLRHTTEIPSNVTEVEIVTLGFFELHIPVATTPALINQSHSVMVDAWNDVFQKLCADAETNVYPNYKTIDHIRYQEECEKILNSWIDLRAEEDKLDDYTVSHVKLDWQEFWLTVRKVNFDVITAFRFLIGIANNSEPDDQLQAMKTFRAIAPKYPEFNITSTNWQYPFVAQYLVIIPNTLRSVLLATACMLVIALIMIPSITCTVLIVMAIISIDFGVLGFMCLWDINVDTISMVTLIMSIGFAVDFTAHISYAFVTSIGTSNERCIRAMETLGWPILQGATSTMLGIFVLYLTPAYLISTFGKTVALVMVFGVMHSLMFLPVLLTTVLPLAERLRVLICGHSSRHPQHHRRSRNSRKIQDEHSSSPSNEGLQMSVHPSSFEQQTGLKTRAEVNGAQL